jgi:hypothetical protein
MQGSDPHHYDFEGFGLGISYNLFHGKMEFVMFEQVNQLYKS